MTEPSHWCGRCGTGLRSGALFCPQCGRRVIEREEVQNGPGFTEVGSQRAVPGPGPDVPVVPERGDWNNWYAATGQGTAYRSPADQPPTPPVPVYRQPVRPPSRAPLIWSVVAAVAVAAAAATLFLLHPFSNHETVSNAGNSTRQTSTPALAQASSSASASTATSVSSSPSGSVPDTTSASPSPTPVTEQQAASSVASMLSSSVADRTSIDDAYNDVDNCGPNLNADPGVFTRAANSRRAILASLTTMPGRSALPPALLSDLTQAWQASIAADQGFVRWANDEITQGCVAHDTNDPGYQSTVTPDNEATQDKTDFTAEWNPIAARYGLTTYQQDQL
jgi:hypothetical protein